MTELKQHQNGPLTVVDDVIMDVFGNIINEPAVIVDMDSAPDATLVLLKFGDKSRVEKHYLASQAHFAAKGLSELFKYYTMLVFHPVTGFADYDNSQHAVFTKDEICTLINWLNNAIYVKQYEDLIYMSIENARKKLADLAACGF